MSHKGWIGVDLDGTLAIYDKWVAWNVIGPVIEPMKQRILKWLEEGKTVKIFTARVAFEVDKCYVTGVTFTCDMIEKEIQDWLELNGMPRLECTATKDFQMIELWDDRAVQVIPNTGRTLHEGTESELTALRGKP